MKYFYNKVVTVTLITIIKMIYISFLFYEIRNERARNKKETRNEIK